MFHSGMDERVKQLERDRQRQNGKLDKLDDKVEGHTKLLVGTLVGVVLNLVVLLTGKMGG